MEYDERDRLLNALDKSHEFMTSALSMLMELEKHVHALTGLLQQYTAYLLINAKEFNTLKELLIDYELIEPDEDIEV